MLTPPAGLAVYVATRPVDFRKGAYGLALLAKETLGHDPMNGLAVVFRAKRADLVKIVVWDGSGLVMYWKRLEKGGFKWPPIVDGVMRMNAAQMAALLDYPC
jgi:transposase